MKAARKACKDEEAEAKRQAAAEGKQVAKRKVEEASAERRAD